MGCGCRKRKPSTSIVAINASKATSAAKRKARKKAIQRANAAAAKVKKTKISRPIEKKRMAICAECEFNKDQKCTKSGRLLFIVVKDQSSPCPLGKFSPR